MSVEAVCGIVIGSIVGSFIGPVIGIAYYEWRKNRGAK